MQYACAFNINRKLYKKLRLRLSLVMQNQIIDFRKKDYCYIKVRAKAPRTSGFFKRDEEPSLERKRSIAHRLSILKDGKSD